MSGDTKFVCTNCMHSPHGACGPSEWPDVQSQVQAAVAVAIAAVVVIIIIASAAVCSAQLCTALSLHRYDPFRSDPIRSHPIRFDPTRRQRQQQMKTTIRSLCVRCASCREWNNLLHSPHFVVSPLVLFLSLLLSLFQPLFLSLSPALLLWLWL